jgi:hypothetical protein
VIREGRHRSENIITKSIIYDKPKRAIIFPTMALMEENNVKVTPMFMGTRADLAPNPLPRPVFAWDCAKCHAKTYSVAEPPPDAIPVCNMCASQITEQAEQDASTKVMWGMTNELEDNVRNIAEEKQRPEGEVFNRFLEWKLRRPIKVSPYTTSEKKKAAG